MLLYFAVGIPGEQFAGIPLLQWMSRYSFIGQIVVIVGNLNIFNHVFVHECKITHFPNTFISYKSRIPKKFVSLQAMKKLIDWCKQYLSVTMLVIVAFLAIILFFNDNSISKSVEYNNRIKELRQEIKSNQDTLEHYRRLNHSLDTDPETMERIVREQYHMQRENEDVYIIE